MTFEARVAKLEASVTHIESDIKEIRTDVREIRTDLSGIRKDHEKDFRLLFGAIIFTALGLAGMMAKGFGWFN